MLKLSIFKTHVNTKAFWHRSTSETYHTADHSSFLWHSHQIWCVHSPPHPTVDLHHHYQADLISSTCQGSDRENHDTVCLCHEHKPDTTFHHRGPSASEKSHFSGSCIVRQSLPHLLNVSFQALVVPECSPKSIMFTVNINETLEQKQVTSLKTNKLSSGRLLGWTHGPTKYQAFVEATAVFLIKEYTEFIM